MALLVIIYLIIRIFFTPSLLSDTHFSRAYYDRDGKLLRMTLSADDKYRIYTPLNEISPTAARAIILYEDKYFRYHPGVNPVALVKAARGYFSDAPRPAGASTITMQVARMHYKINTKRPVGKLKQIAAAIYIDLFHSKNEILAAYLNLAPYGGNVEGIGAAAQIFFHKSARDLSTIESITLATVPQNPTRRNLATKSGLENVMAMRADLIRRWIAANPDAHDIQKFADMNLATYSTTDLPFRAPHFVNHIIKKTENYWNDIGPRESDVITTLDLALTERLAQELARQIGARKSIGVQNAAAILVNYKTMETLAYIGSADYFNKSIFGENDGVTARRSPGSTLKPLIYAAAVDRGLIHGMTLMKDAKINFGVYAPENADSEFYGPVLARDALTHSRNIPAINLIREIGARNFYNLLVESGVTNLKQPEHYGISIALGGAEVSMFELADIYATMANLGQRRNIKMTQSPQHRRDTAHQILRPEAFFLVLDMLGRQSNGARNIPFAKNQRDNIRHYWKTGTSSSFRDAWTAGIFGDYVLIVWVGNFDGRPNNAFSGAKTAAPIYFALSRVAADYYATRDRPIENNNFLRDDMNISIIDMCADVGGIAGAQCPRAVPAYFIPGVSPIDMSTVHRAEAIDNKTGLRACQYDPATTHMETFEFWDSEYLDMFRRAGIRRHTPPNFMPGCDLDKISDARATPVITSPIDGTRTVILDGTDASQITFRAITDMENVKIFWFLDNDVIGTTMPGETMTHSVQMGPHTIRAVDEMGAATENKFMVVK